MRLHLWAIGAIAAGAILFSQQKPEEPPYQPSAEELGIIRSKLATLRSELRRLPDNDKRADVEVYAKAADWILRFPEEFHSKDYYSQALAVLDRGLHRVRSFEGAAWTKASGRVSRAYRSAVDGSVQPYGLMVPDGYDGRQRMRLDVELHGRAAKMNEVSFLHSHDSEKPVPADRQDRITLQVFGRTNNAYRWAGETDVFEAIASVRARYNIDPDRIVLRGFSMGGAGAWHLGLHHPGEWAAVEAGAGFVETREYARLTDLPPYQDKVLSIYDAAEYAANAVLVPVVGYGGEEDKQLRASQTIQERLGNAGLQALFLVGPKTGHKWHPESLARSDTFLDAAVRRGRSAPERIRATTFTTRFNQFHWLTVDALDQHYVRATVEGTPERLTTTNVAALSLKTPASPTIDGQATDRGTHFVKRDGKWQAGSVTGMRKRHGLQGPIDDAFMTPFVVVGDVPEKHAHVWQKYLRGDVPRAAAPAAGQHIVTFGDPTTNPLIARVNSRLQIRWDGGNIVAGELKYPAANHDLVLICPNPLDPERYLVLNTLHTFGEREFRGTNALLFPRLGDWAIVKKASGEVVAAGLFDEHWKLAEVTRHDTPRRP